MKKGSVSTPQRSSFNFTPGRELSGWLEKFRKKHGFDYVQDAVRDILRDRKRQDEIEAAQTR